MGAALGARDRVHLVQDHRLDAGQRVARGRCQHQEEGLRGGDQDVRRPGGQCAALGGRGVAGADADLHLGLGQAEAHGLLADAGQRAAKVALDVDGQGLERRDVQHAAALLGVGGRGCRGELVQGGEEGGQRLARTGGGDHQHVGTLRDGLPRARLGGRGRGEGPREPAAGRGGEAVEGSVCGADHGSIVHPATDNRPEPGVRAGRGAGREPGVRRAGCAPGGACAGWSVRRAGGESESAPRPVCGAW